MIRIAEERDVAGILSIYAPYIAYTELSDKLKFRLSAFVSIGAQAPLPPSLREVGRRRRLGGSALLMVRHSPSHG